MRVENAERKYPLPCVAEPESLFDRCSWFYAFCREHLFRDHTAVMAEALWAAAGPAAQSHLVELGCGPGFYACSFAERYPHLQITGIDLSASLISRARDRACAKRLTNCEFQRVDVLSLSKSFTAVDAIIASRLFMIVPERQQAIAEIFAALRPGGRCFIAEPTSALRAMLPLSCMWLFARLTGDWGTEFHEPGRAAVLNPSDFKSLVVCQPWNSVRLWNDEWYQYAVCERRA